MLGTGWPPTFVRHDSQRDKARNQQRGVDTSLRAGGKTARQDVRVQISEQQSRLKKHEADSPHGRHASEPRQDHLRDDGLDLEQKERAREDRNSEQQLRLRTWSSNGG